jgi:HEPN domain-containing protein
MTGPSTDRARWSEVTRWLVFVDDDLRTAEILVKSSPPLLLGAAFHCQQAVEKMAKAVLVAVGAEVPKIHDIYELSWRVGVHHTEIGETVRKLGNLTSWATVARYPDVESDVAPSLDDIRTALPQLIELRRAIAALAPKVR